MLRDDGVGVDSTTKIFAPRQWWLSFFFLRARARKSFRAKAFSGIASRKWEVYSAAFSSGVITGWLGFTKEKNGSRTEGCDAVTRLDPMVTHHGNRNRAEVGI